MLWKIYSTYHYNSLADPAWGIWGKCKVATKLGEICNFLLLTHLKQTSNQLQSNHRSHHILGASKNYYRVANSEAQEAIFVVVRMQ